MEAEKCSGLYWLCMEAENRSCAGSSPVTEPPAQPIDEMSDSQLGGVQETVGVNSVPAGNEAPAVVNAEVKVGERGADKRRRGRPPKGEANPPAKRRKKKEDEDVCFICFDGGSLVLCDRRDCPKAYHPACIKRDEAFFRSKAKWNCGWHICSKCQKSAHYMCYTCTYSLCKTCTKDADFLCVRENKGFCSTCMRIVKLIENIDQGNKAVQVDFDDKSSWEYLFKVYWICLKEDLSLTLDELTHAKNPWRAAGKVVRRERSAAVYYVGNNGMMMREHPKLPCKGNCYTPVKPVCDSDKTSVISTWASKELLEFVADMKNGDTSVLSQLEVQALLFDYIKTNNLRDPQQRSEIICDSKLVNLFRKPRVRHFEMLSLLEFHFLSKDDSQKDEFEGDIVDPVVSQVEGESNSDNLLMISENHKHKIHIKDEKGGNKDVWNEGKDACEKPGNQVDSSGSANNGQNNQACLKTESLSGVKSETSVASLSTGSTPSANDREAENSWRYRDPNGKVQGPFGIVQLHKWSTTGIFPPDMRIWSINNEEGNSVLLSDVLKGQAPLQNNLSLSPQDIKGTSESRSHHCDGPWSGSVNSTGIDAHSNGKLEFVKGNGPAPHSSDWSTPAINNDPQIENSSKCWDAPKVNNSYSDQPQVHCAERSSAFTERPHETSVHQATGNVGQRWNSAPNYENWNSQGDMISETAGRQCHEHQINNSQHYLGQPSAEGTLPPNFSVNSWNSHESHPQYTSMANITEPSEHKFSIDLQKFPTPMPKTSNGELEAQTIKEQQWQPSQNSVPDLSTHNMRSLTPKSSDSDEKADSRIQKMASPTNNYEKIQSIENKHSLSLNFPAQDSGPSWSSASSLVVGGGNQLSKKATKPSIEEWDSGFVSLSSLKPQDVASDHVATPTSKRDELAPPSPPDPVPNASSWLAMVTEPIEFSTLAEESVSDLLAEVDAMESHSDLASPNMVMDYGEELFHDNSKTDCFTSLRGLSSPLDQGKNDALSSSGDIRVPPESTMRNEPLRASHNDILDPLKRPRKHSSTSSVMDVETKRFDTPVNQLESRSNRQFPTPPIKTRDLADIFNAPVVEVKYVDSGRGTKQGTLNSPGSTRRESGQGTPRGSGSKNRSNPAGLTGRESHQKHGGERLTSPRDRNFESGDSGFSKGRPSWSRQSSFGGGGGGGSHSRPPRGQRVCKFYENGYCRKGAFCDYLHP